MSHSAAYSLKREGEQLIFMTPSYQADKGSVLHQGIYNHEFASMISSLIVCGSAYALLAFNLEITAVHYISLIILFMAVFISFRKFIFREKELKAVFDGVKKKYPSLCRGFLATEQKM